ncbi:HoxN/HupN/NixA family nickel/cobalt transporter [Roseibium limicola]|nr:DUF1007 family protein [Roseibium limicola]
MHFPRLSALPQAHRLGSLLLSCLMLLLGFAESAQAHPHVFVEARSTLLMNDQGLATGVRHVFRFDDAYTAFAIQGFDKDGDGAYSREELAELAQVNIESMGDFGYFTFGDNGRVELDFKPRDGAYWLELVDVPMADYWALSPEDLKAMREDAEKYGSPLVESVKLLELHFELALASPSDLTKALTLDVYDPTYYVDFRFSHEPGALGVENGPGSCTVERHDPPSLDMATQMALAQVGPDQRNLPPELQSAAASQVNQMIVTCPDAVAGPVTASNGLLQVEGSEAGPVTTPDAADTNDIEANAAEVAAAKDAVRAMAEGSANPQLKPGDAVAPVATAASPNLADKIFGGIAAVQAQFYQKLISALRGFRNGPHAAWILVSISFLYGIFHAAGPGHGKAIISTYVIANNETLKKGILLSFLSAFAQAVTAIILVGGLAAVFNLTSLAIQDTATWLEIGSYTLVTALGAYLLWTKGLSRLFGKSGGHHHHGHSHEHSQHHAHSHGDDHAHSHHDHDHHGEAEVCSSCGHAHAPTPAMVQGKMSLSRMVSIVLAVGLRPCSGALIVLVFAFGQNMVLAGIGSSFAMAVGTGLTVSALASLAVFAREGALKIFGSGSSAAGRVLWGMEIFGALTIFLIGATLLTATLGWGM